MNRRASHVAAIALLLAMPLILLWPCLIGDRSYVPWDIAQFAPAATMMDEAELAATTENNNTIVTEIPAMFVPELRFLKSEFERGEFPHWNPYSRSGTSAWASSILGVWYPLNWMMLVNGDPVDDLALGAFFSIAIAALLMYGLLIHVKLSVPAALFGALAFALSGTLTVNLHFYQRINALIWLPGLLWSISAICQHKGVRRVPALLGLIGCMFMTHTAGFPPFAIAATLIAVAFTVYRLAGHLPGSGFKVTFGLAMTIAAGALLGVLLGTVQTMPALEFFPESNRTMTPSGNVLASGGYDPAGWLGYFCPTIFNHPHINHVGGLRDEYSPLFWLLYSRTSWLPQDGIPAGTIFNPNLNFCEYTVFVGTLTLFLAVIGLFGKKTPLRLFIIGGLACLMLIATAHPMTEVLLSKAPFRLVPPTRYTGAMCMFVAYLAAVGIQEIHRIGPLLRHALSIGGYAVSATFTWLAWWAHDHTPEQILAAFTPSLQEKFAARFPHVPLEDLPVQIARFMGPDMTMARGQMVDNFSTAAIASFLCATLFLALPTVLKWKRGHLAVLALAFFMTGYELLSFGIPLNTGRTLMRRPLNDTPIHQFLREQRDKYAEAGGFSIMRAHDPHEQRDKYDETSGFSIMRAHDPQGTKNPVTLPSQLPPDTLLNEHIRDQQAYTFVDRRSHLPFRKLYGPEQLARNTWPMSVRDSELLNLPYWDMLGIRFLLSENPLGDHPVVSLQYPGNLYVLDANFNFVNQDLGWCPLKLTGKRVGPTLSGPENAEVKTKHFYIYERPHPLPRAWVVHDFRSVSRGLTPDAEDDAIVDELIKETFQPRDVAILDPSTAEALGENPYRNAVPGNSRKVRFPIAHQTNDLLLEVAEGDPGYLILNDTFMSGWTATVNGEPAEIQRANLFQRMIALPAQAAKVELRYVTPGFYAGLAMSGVSLLLVILLAVWYLLRRRNQVAGSL